MPFDRRSAPDDPGELPPAGLTWSEYIERWVGDRGGWLPLADQLIHRAGDAVEIAQDPQTVERGLRRLARRHHKPGGQYGRWMLRFFGFTSQIEPWVKWLGKHHSRFSDLPSGLRLEQLALWNRPPIAESPLACWIHVGIAAAHHARLDRAACESWLVRAERHARAAGTAAEIEVALLRARLAADAGERAAVQQHCREIDERLAPGSVSQAEEACYRARLHHQRAEQCTRPAAGDAPDLAAARAYYEQIPDSTIPFVVFHKAAGLAYCEWKLGRSAEARRLAEYAVDAAGDGGLVRMRVMALNMLSRVVPAERSAELNERARRMARALDDEDLMRRVADCAPPR